jgi:hypothetical protein
MKKNKKNQEKENLPGYPHYPAKEDILNDREHNADRVPIDVENISRQVDINTNLSQVKKNFNSENISSNDEINMAAGNESDLNADDFVALGDKDLSMDAGDDDLLKDGLIHNFDDSELDIPGAELDDDMEETGNEDEENNYYSLGDTK